VMRPSFVSLLMRPSAPPIWAGIVVAVALIAVETIAVIYLRQLTGKPFGILYMVDVMVISTVWGFGLSAVTSVASAVAYAYFRTWPDSHFVPTELSFWVSIAVFLFVALLANSIAAVARVGERFAELSCDVLAIVGPDQFIRVNPACTDLLGYSEEELTSQPWIGFVAPEDRDRVRSFLVETGEPIEPVRFEIRMVSKHGASRWVEWNVVWRRGLAYAIGRDMTERRREQDQLRQTKAMLEASRDEFSALARQQEALRRIATLVAHGVVAPTEIFAAVAEEMVRCLDTDAAGVFRYDEDGASLVIASFSKPGSQYFPVGERLPADDENLLAWIRHSGRPARHDDLRGGRGPVIVRVREMGIRSGVGAPVIVGGAVWGAVIVAPKQRSLLPVGTEERVGDFADLVAAAISNAASRADLVASRARIVAAADNARRRIERNLHDGAQQRLVTLKLRAAMALSSVPDEMADLKEELTQIKSGLTDAHDELRELGRGVHPAVLSSGGLVPALNVLARRSPLPVTLDVAVEHRLPQAAEVAAYYVVAESLTNAAKYSRASDVTVSAHTAGTDLVVCVQDNGIGEADLSKGSGLIGLADRVAALGGHMQIDSPAGVGTVLRARIPLESANHDVLS
jgi:PAS domain S-box-containing protein